MEVDENTTLRQGLQAFYAEYTDQLSHTDEELPQEVKDFFRSHDIAHVLFGCDISLLGEGSVKIWTIFGTTLGFWKHIGEYKKANAFELSKKLDMATVIGDFFRLLFSIPTLIIRAKRMTRPWPWDDHEAYLDRSLQSIREEFNIKIL